MGAGDFAAWIGPIIGFVVIGYLIVEGIRWIFKPKDEDSVDSPTQK